MNAVGQLLFRRAAISAAFVLGLATLTTAQEAKPKPAVVQVKPGVAPAKPVAAPVRETGKSIEIEPKKRKSIVTAKFPYTLEYWTGNQELGWKKVTLDEPGTYGFQFSKGRFAVTTAAPAAEGADVDPAEKTKISLANSGTHPVTIHLPAKKAPAAAAKPAVGPRVVEIAAKPVKLEERLAGPEGVVLLFPNGPAMAAAARQGAAAANEAANARLLAEQLALHQDGLLKDALILGLQTQNALKQAQLDAALLPPGPARDAADAKVAQLQADLAVQGAAFKANRAAFEAAKADAAVAQQAHLAAALKAAGLLPPGDAGPAPIPAVAKLIGGAETARKVHEAAKVAAVQADLQVKDARVEELRALGELFAAKADDDAADKKLAAAVQDEMKKKGTPGEAAAKALVAKLQAEKAASKKKLDAATTKVADAVKKIADKQQAAGVAKLAEDKARNAVRAACAKLVEFALRNA